MCFSATMVLSRPVKVNYLHKNKTDFKSQKNKENCGSFSFKVLK